MATTPEAARLTETHRIAQARIGTQTVQQMLAAWGILDPTDVDGSVDRWLAVVLPVIRSNRTQSAQLAAAYTTAFRSLEVGQPGRPPDLAADFELDAVVTSLIVTGPAALKAATARGLGLRTAAQLGASRSAAAAMRHALNGGRDTVMRSIRSDSSAVGYYRVTSGNTCAFCAMVASQGVIYKDQDRAGFQPHDRCACGPEPVYRSDSRPPATSQRYADLWQSTTEGLSGADAVAAFRSAFDAEE